MSLGELGQLLWSAQGISTRFHDDTYRTAPSAGALYPLELCVMAGNVEGLEPGTYVYAPEPHALTKLHGGDTRYALPHLAFKQDWLARAPVVFVFFSVESRTAAKYGEETARPYVWMEAGHAAQNALLQAEALGLRGCVVAAISDRVSLAKQLGVPEEWSPMVLIPLGAPLDL
eukprot:m51a1_g3061 hypothetical protein (173) ;mRNA; r:1003397-1004014